VSIKKEDVHYIAKLARLALKEEEVAVFEAQLGRILNYIDILNEVNTSEVEPLYYTFYPKVTPREDEAKPFQQEIINLEEFAPQFEEEHFVVPSIIERQEES